MTHERKISVEQAWTSAVKRYAGEAGALRERQACLAILQAKLYQKRQMEEVIHSKVSVDLERGVVQIDRVFLTRLQIRHILSALGG